MHQLTNSQAIYEPNYRRQYQLSYGLEMAGLGGIEPSLCAVTGRPMSHSFIVP